MKICIDCEHCDIDILPSFSICKLVDPEVRRNPVTGFCSSVRPAKMYCSYQRGADGDCGSDGRLWEERRSWWRRWRKPVSSH